MVNDRSQNVDDPAENPPSMHPPIMLNADNRAARSAFAAAPMPWGERLARGLTPPPGPLFALAAAAVLVLAVFGFGRAVLARKQGDAFVAETAVHFQPYDARLWAAAHARSFSAARRIDPSLPDPEAIAPADRGASTSIDADRLRQEAYVGPAALPYVFHGTTGTDTANALRCLTDAIYYEAASESDDGMRGVAQVVLNRVRHPSFPNSVCGVVFQGSQRTTGCQFSFTCDGAMARVPLRSVWLRAQRIASEALSGRIFAPVGLATHYHTQAVWPYWGKTLVMTNVIGAHIFHRWRGRWGEPRAFRQPYSGRETQTAPIRPITEQLAAKAAAPPATAAPMDAAREGQPGDSVHDASRQIGLAGNDAKARAANAGQSGQSRAAPARDRAYLDPALARSGTARSELENSGRWIGTPDGSADTVR